MGIAYIEKIEKKQQIANLVVERESVGSYIVSMDGMPLVRGTSEKVHKYLKIIGLVAY